MAAIQSSNSINSGALPDSNEIRTFLTQLDSTFHARVNILLVAESLFLAGLSQVWGTKETGIILVICLIAIISTKILWDPLRVLAERTAGIARLLEKDSLYQKYIGSSPAPLNQTHRLANWIPWLFVGSWLIIIALALLRKLGQYPWLFTCCETAP